MVQLSKDQGATSSGQLCVFLLAETSNSGVVSQSPPQRACFWLSSSEIKKQKSSVDPLALTIVSHVDTKCRTYSLDLLDNLDTTGARRKPLYSAHSLERQMFEEAGYRQPGEWVIG